MIESIDNLQIDQDSCIVNETSLKKIQEPFLSQVNWGLLNYIYSKYNNAMYSAYLVGDIPRGIGSNTSKINLLIVLHKGNQYLCKPIKNFLADIVNPYDVKYNVEVISYDHIFANNYGAIKYKFIIKTFSICLFGEDVSNLIRKYTISDMNKIIDL
jgi:hypothetical protein